MLLRVQGNGLSYGSPRGVETDIIYFYYLFLFVRERCHLLVHSPILIVHRAGTRSQELSTGLQCGLSGTQSLKPLPLPLRIRHRSQSCESNRDTLGILTTRPNTHPLISLLSVSEWPCCDGHWTQWCRCCLGCPHPLLECLDLSPDSSSLLMHTLGGRSGVSGGCIPATPTRSRLRALA